MFHVELNIGLQRIGVTLALVSAISLGLVGCGEKTAPSKKSPTAILTPSDVDNKSSESKIYDGPLFPALKDGKYGFIDINGSFKIPPTFTSAKQFSEGLAAVYVGGQSFVVVGETRQYIGVDGGQWGYIDRSGEIKITPQFGYANPFSEGLALVTSGNGMEGEAGYIDKSGLFKISPKFDALFSSAFANGIAAVRLAKIEKINIEKDGFFDSSGKKISSAKAIQMIKESARLRDGHWIDSSGAEIDSFKALAILNVDRVVFEKKNIVKIHGANYEVSQYGLKDLKGRVVVPAKFDRLSDFYYRRNLEKSEYEEACIASTWETVGDFARHTAVKCGLIDADGHFVAPPDFDSIFMRSKELAVFQIGCEAWPNCENGKMGIFSVVQKKIVVNPRFDSIQIFGDLIAVKADGKYGYIEINGKYAIEPKFSYANVFRDGLAQVDFPENYIDKSGKYVYKGSIGAVQQKAQKSSVAIASGNAPSEGTILKKSSAGTAFFINKEGYAVTNYHVIDECKEVRVAGRDGIAKVSTSDAMNDIALLQVPGMFNDIATINSDPTRLRQGDDIVVFGFPLNSLLSSGGNLTPGIVSALTGLGNNSSQIQITAPIQPGSSGSPVLNKKGEVVGVVSMKLSDSKMAKATGQVGQNVNFAVSGQTLKSFLDAHKVNYVTGGLMSFNKSTSDLADEAKKWTIVVECWK